MSKPRPNNETNIYQRHTAACKLKTPARCTCPYWIYGWINGARVRETLNTSRLDIAVDRQRRREGREQASAAAAPAPAAARSINDAVAAYLAYCPTNNIAPQTIEKYKHALDRFAADARKHGMTTLADLSVDALKTYVSVSMKPYKERTRHLHFVILKSFFLDCVERELITKVPLPRRAPATPKGGAYRPLVAEEKRRLWQACTTPKQRAILLTLLSTGLRVSDVANLNRKHINFAAREIRIVPVKTSKHAIEVILPELPAQLFAAINALPQTIDGNLFGMSSNAIYQLITNKIGRAARVDVTPHDLRCTFAVDRLTEGASIYDVSKLLGHSTVATTERYYIKWIPALDDRLKRVMSAADQSFMRAA